VRCLRVCSGPVSHLCFRRGLINTLLTVFSQEGCTCSVNARRSTWVFGSRIARRSWGSYQYAPFPPPPLETSVTESPISRISPRPRENPRFRGALLFSPPHRTRCRREPSAIEGRIFIPAVVSASMGDKHLFVARICGGTGAAGAALDWSAARPETCNAKTKRLTPLRQEPHTFRDDAHLLLRRLHQ